MKTLPVERRVRIGRQADNDLVVVGPRRLATSCRGDQRERDVHAPRPRLDEWHLRERLGRDGARTARRRPDLPRLHGRGVQEGLTQRDRTADRPFGQGRAPRRDVPPPGGRRVDGGARARARDDATHLTGRSRAEQDASPAQSRPRRGQRDHSPSTSFRRRRSSDATPSCHVTIPDSSVSHRHARVYHSDGEWYVEDLGSTNGTFVNDRPLTRPGRAATRRHRVDRPFDARGACVDPCETPGRFRSPTPARVREKNEDSILADAAAGRRRRRHGRTQGAARSPRASLSKSLQPWKERLSGTDRRRTRLETLREAFDGRQPPLCSRRATRTKSVAGMGTTLTAAWINDNTIAIAHVGDSRAYLLRGGTLQQLTEDQNVAQELVRRGRLSARRSSLRARTATSSSKRSAPTRRCRRRCRQRRARGSPGDRLVLATRRSVRDGPARPRSRDILERQPRPRRRMPRTRRRGERSRRRGQHLRRHRRFPR